VTRAGRTPPAAPAGAGRRAATRERVIAAAIELIAEQGFSGTTVDEIATLAGVAKGTVFYNFASKEQLFAQALRHGVGRLTDAFRTACQEKLGYRAIDALILAELEHVHASPAFAQIMVAELYRTGRPWQQTLTEIRAEAVGVVREVLIDAQAAGDLDPELDAELAAGALLGATLVVALDWLAYAPRRTLQEVHAATMRMVRGRLTTAAQAGIDPPETG
jgi:AcrR family transcriptional regulator